VRGDVRSGVLSFGDFFVEHDADRKTFTGAPKPKPGVQRNNRVISYACQNCGLASSFLQRIVDDEKNPKEVTGANLGGAPRLETGVLRAAGIPLSLQSTRCVVRVADLYCIVGGLHA
jgi:hypothetical protein